MKKNIILFAIALLWPFFAFSNNTDDTRFLTQPAVSESHVAFIYAGDLWIANIDGSMPRRLTIDEGIESNPHFSPDGKSIAFSASYDGNVDVFTISVEGGIPKRLTYHPGADIVRGFTDDGNVLFITQRTIHTRRYSEFYEVSPDGDFPEKLIVPHGNRASYSPDGNFLAYTPGREVFNQWKGYRGGTVSRIWLFSFDNHEVTEIPKPATGANDTQPIWIGDKIYFRSDRDGEFNLYSYDQSTEQVEKLTNHNDFPVLWASGSANNIIYEQAGKLHLYSLSNGSTTTLDITISTDLPELRKRFVSGNQYIRSSSISPSGNRAVFDFRGDIVTVPREKGDPRNITSTQGVHEKYPAWSPDGKSIAYFSDESGEYALHIEPQDGKGSVQKIDLTGAGFYAYPHWSPDSRLIAFSDNSRSLFIVNVASESVKKVAQDVLYTPGAFRDLFGDWSSDSKWITYTKIIESNFEQVFLFNLENEESYPVSDGLSNASSPVFDESGKYLYFLASTDAGPVVNWFDQSNQDMQMSSSIYLATLQNDLPSPFAKKSDEVVTDGTDTGDKEEKSDVSDENAVRIDLEGLQKRIIDVPLNAGTYRNLTAGKSGQIYFMDNATSVFGNPPGQLHRYDINSQESDKLMQVSSYKISSDKEKILYSYNGEWHIGNAVNPAESNQQLDIDAIKLKIDPAKEWANMFYEAWRVNRDYFYDPGMHGADWQAMKEKYEVFLPHLSSRQDLNKLIQWMSSELRVGHHRISNSGDMLYNPESVPGGLLGADYEIDNGRYRISKIYGGLNWNPDLVSPLTEPGINAKEGDYILAVDGTELTGEMNIFSLFEHTANRIVELTIGPNPDFSKSRTVKVTPIASETSLRNRAWVEGNLRKVHKATDGKVAYVYVPNTTTAGHQYFKRYFFPQADKQAIIVDERYNGGGQLADYYIDILMRPYQSYWNFRYGKDLKTPSASIQGPKVLIIDENAGSGGDMFPWMFRKFDVGTIIGKRTWGGLVGILGFPEFIDGGSVTAPNLAIWTKDGFIVENVGVAPDIEVEQWPKDLIEGRDPQLEKAIEVVMEQLEKNPPEKPKRPPYPDKTKN